MYVYDKKETPPCPCINVSIESLFGRKVSGIKAILDTGASKTAVPIDVLDILNLTRFPTRRIRVRDYSEREVWRYIYYVHILHPEFTCLRVEVIGIDRGATMLIGRDIINKWRLLLDGHKQVFNLER
ncbi:MAG: hypothetical protein QME42_08320 [bacterium]|nr:hypothetical protein [bacterium]